MAIFGLVALRSVAFEVEPEAGSPVVVSPGGPIEPAAPVVPAELAAAMQEGRYDDVRRALTALADAARTPDDRAYFKYLRGIAERLAGARDAARATLRTALQAAPATRWAAKIQYELAGIELASGNLEAAEQLTRAEAELLLAGDRKDRLAEVYHAYARQLLEPKDPVVRPDPKAAYDLLDQARDLAKSPALRARFLVAMGRASLAAMDVNKAIENFQAYLKEYPDGADRLRVRLQLGEAQRLAQQLLPARLTWTDLVRDIQRLGPAEQTPEMASIRAQALSEIPSTFGMPNPPDNTSLNLGVAAIKRFLDTAPAHPRAVRAAFQIGAAYQVRGKDTQALDGFARFQKEEGFRIESDEARRDWAELSMTASFQVGRILLGQQQFAEAIAAWKGYLARFPNGPQSADAQRAILETQLAIAADHLDRGHFPEARAAWSEFVAQNPLDARLPAILFRIGESFEKEKRFDRAITAWEPLTSKFPGSEPAAHAQFAIAAIFETEKGDPAEAIERFRKISVEPWQSQARQRIAVMEAKHLVVVTPRTFRSGEDAHLKITTRNLETLNFTAYKLSAEAYFRKKNALNAVETLDIGLVAPDASWTAPVPGYARYKPVEASYDLKKLQLPGVYVVKVTDEKTFQATTLVVGSDIDAIVKTSRDQILVFAQDMKTGQGRAGARVLVADGGQVVFEATTGPDGVLLRNWESPRNLNQDLSYLILDGPHVAGSHLAVPNQVAQGLSPRAYIDTDRPAYRPGQKVSIRGVVREVREGQYANVPGAVYRLEVADSRGRLIVARPVTLSDFGTFHDSVPLDAAAPLGTYRITVSQPGKSVFSGGFEVQSYQLEPIDLSFELKQSVVYRGETVQADVVARYQYGAPMASRPIEVALPDGRTLYGQTDAAGKYHVAFSTEGFAEEQTLRLTARLPQDNVSQPATIRLAVRAFEIGLSTARDVYLDGESFPLQVVTTDAQGEPIGESLSATLVKQVTTEGRVTERDVLRKTMETDPKTGRGSLSFRADDPQGGQYLLRVAGTDRFGTPIVADRAIFVSGKKDETKLRLLTDRQRYKVGEQASVNLHSRGRAGTALLAWEAERILSYRIVTLKEGDNALSWQVDGAQFPNFTLTSTRMWQNESDEARLDIQVERDLRVTVKPAKSVVGPGEPVELDVTAVDQLGRPVSAELSIAMVDQSLLRLFHDSKPSIGPFFYNQARTGAFATEATNTFRYEPPTVAVSQAVVDESERAAAMAANAADRGRIMQEAQGQVLALVPMSAPSAPEPASPPAVDLLRRRPMVGRALAGGGRGDAGVDSLQGAELADEKDKALGDAKGTAFARSFSDLSEEKAATLGKRSTFAAMAPSKSLFPIEKPSSREKSVETAYWNPAVVTDKDGKAQVTFKAPSALSEYRITARGVTGSDTLAGQSTTSLTVRKNFFVDLKVPASLTQGDKPRFIAQVHNMGVRGTVALRLAIYAGDRDDVLLRTIELKEDGVAEAIFEPFEVPDGDSVRSTLTGSVGEIKDELIVEIPIHPWGVPVFASASGTGRESTTAFIGLPSGRTYENLDMLISVSPSVQRMLIELALGRDARAYRDHLGAHSAARVLPAPTNTTADRAAELMAATSAPGLSPRGPRRRRPGGASVDRADSGPGRRADRRAEPRRRLALGLSRSLDATGSESASRRSLRTPDLGVGLLGDGLGRTAGPADGSQDPRPGDGLPQPGIRRAQRRRSRDPRRLASCVEHPPSGRLRGGEQPESIAERSVRLRLGLSRAHFRQPGSRLDGRRADRNPRPSGQDGGQCPGPSGSTVLGPRRSSAVHPVRIRDHGPRDLGLCPGPSPGPRARARRRLARGAPHRSRMAAAQGQGSGIGGAGILLRPGSGRRGPIPVDRIGQRHPGRRSRRARHRRGQGRRRPEGGAQARPTQPRPVRHGGSRSVRIRRHPLGVHPRVRPGSGSAPIAWRGSSAAPTTPRPESSTASPWRSVSRSPSTRATSRTSQPRSGSAAGRRSPCPHTSRPPGMHPSGSVTSSSSRRTCPPARP